jgi:hypothetical protein
MGQQTNRARQRDGTRRFKEATTRRCQHKGGKWIKEIPNALWGLRSQPTKPTEQSSYFLVYGSEAILPTYVMWESPAAEQYDECISEDNR